MTSNTDIPQRIEATPFEQVRAEREKLTLGHRSRPKVFQHQTYDDGILTLLTMRRFSGQSLQSLIDGQYPFSLEQRLKLSIALLRALKEQVHDLNLIHRDIKPGNIIVDVNTMEVNIIDFGLSIHKDRPDNTSCGTPVYSSPEIITTPANIDEKTDIYSMGRLLAQLWGDNHDIWHREQLHSILSITRQGNYNLKHLFEINNKAYKSKDPKTPDKIKSAIRHMVRSAPENRHSIDDLITQFHTVYLAEHYHQKVKVNDTTILSDSFKHGLAIRTKLAKSKNAADFVKTLKVNLHKIPDNPACIKEFTHGLGWQALQSATSKNQVTSLAISVIIDYEKSLNQYIALLNDIINTLQQYKAIINTDIFSEFRELYYELNHKVERITERPFDFDWLQKSTKALNAKFEYWNNRSIDVNRDIKRAKPLKLLLPVLKKISTKLSIEQTVDALTELKNRLREALQKYMTKTFTDENILNKDRAASIRRQIDITAFNTIIENAKDAKSLINETKKRMSSMETGLFFRSKLRSNLEKAIERHELNHRPVK